MLSVNTNYGAAIALQNLNATSKELEGVQSRISTGFKVASAKDNGAVFAIAEGQRTRLNSLSSVKDGVDRAKSTVDVAVSAGTSIGKILQELKTKAVAAQSTGLSSEQRAALQADFVALRAQIDTIAGSAEFNGTNLVKGSGNDLDVLTSDLTATTATKQITSLTPSNAAGTITGSSLLTDITHGTATEQVADGDVIEFTLTGGATPKFSVAVTATMTVDDFVQAVNAGSEGKVQASFDAATMTFTYKIVDTDYTDIAIASDAGAGQGGVVGAGETSANGTFADTSTYQVTGNDFSLTGALLSSLATFDISTSSATAAAAATALDTAISSLNLRLATLGSQSKALGIQNDFLATLSDSIQGGISNLVDADLAKESAKLQSLQIKQQLGAQALSIANQAPSIITSLFRS